MKNSETSPVPVISMPSAQHAVGSSDVESVVSWETIPTDSRRYIDTQVLPKISLAMEDLLAEIQRLTAETSWDIMDPENLEKIQGIFQSKRAEAERIRDSRAGRIVQEGLEEPDPIPSSELGAIPPIGNSSVDEPIESAVAKTGDQADEEISPEQAALQSSPIYHFDPVSFLARRVKHWNSPESAAEAQKMAEEAAALNIQRGARGLLGRAKSRRQAESVLEAKSATKIQATFRGHQVRAQKEKQVESVGDTAWGRALRG